MSEDKIIINGIELTLYDKLKYINQKINGFNKVWIENIEDDYIIVSGIDGVIKFKKDDIFKIFTKVRKFNENKKWTSWKETKSGFSYRTDNEHYTEVKKDGIKVRSSCHPCDTFNLAKGISVCLQKIKDKKKVNKEKFENSKILYDSRFDILYIDFVKQPTFGYAEWIDKGVYLRKDSNTDAIIGIHIEDFMKNHIKR